MKDYEHLIGIPLEVLADRRKRRARLAVRRRLEGLQRLLRWLRRRWKGRDDDHLGGMLVYGG